MCAIQRPLDTPNQVRIVLESEAILGIITFCENGQADLLSSETLWHEGEQSSLPIRQEHTRSILTKAKAIINVSERKRSERLVGTVDAVRFLKQFTQGYGSYAEERETPFANKSLEDIVSEIEKRRKTE